MRFDEEKRLIKKALLLVDNLAKFEKKGLIGNEDKIEDIIEEAYKISRNRYWDLT